MYKVSGKPICPHCGSENISENLLMKCNCTKGMGRNLQYPKFMCKDCHASFGDKKYDLSKKTVKIVGPKWSLEKTDKGGQVFLGEKKEKSQEVKSLKRREWKRLMDNIFNELYLLEWPPYEDLVQEGSNPDQDLSEPVEVHLKDGQINKLAIKSNHPYILDLNKLIESL